MALQPREQMDRGPMVGRYPDGELYRRSRWGNMNGVSILITLYIYISMEISFPVTRDDLPETYIWILEDLPPF